MTKETPLSTRREGDAFVIRFRERKIMDVAYIEAMAEELFRLVSGDPVKLALNFEGVDFLASAALNKVLTLERRLRGQGGQLALCCLSPTMKDVFAITRLGEVFDIYPDEAGALAGLGTNGSPR